MGDDYTIGRITFSNNARRYSNEGERTFNIISSITKEYLKKPENIKDFLTALSSDELEKYIDFVLDFVYNKWDSTTKEKVLEEGPKHINKDIVDRVNLFKKANNLQTDDDIQGKNTYDKLFPGGGAKPNRGIDGYDYSYFSVNNHNKDNFNVSVKLPSNIKIEDITIEFQNSTLNDEEFSSCIILVQKMVVKSFYFDNNYTHVYASIKDGYLEITGDNNRYIKIN
jgi:hypothetical protein